MRILLLTTHLNLGGIGVYVSSLAKGLVQKGHQVFVLSSGGELAGLVNSFGAKHVRVDLQTKSELSPKAWRARKRILQFIREENIEIIHAHTRVTQVLAHIVARKFNIPYVTTCHGFFKPRLFRLTFPCWGARCIAISEAVREHLVNDLRAKKEKIALVHNGVELERFFPDKFSSEQKQQLKKDYQLQPGPVIGTVARFSSVKGQRYLILAMPEVLKSYPQAQLLLVGSGSEKGELEKLTSELQVENRVYFSPATFDTAVPLSIMDIFVFPSLSEGLGLAILEAQAMGLAVVASDVGGIYTLVKHGINGFLVQAKDPSALAQATINLLGNKQLAQQLGRKAREQVKQSFNLQQMVEGIELVYREVTTR